ncbi:MAG: SGNH/GDSL hydrolase family protein [Aeromicrobium sp.]
MTDRSPWPLLTAIVVTFAVGIASLATRDERSAEPQVRKVAATGPTYVAIGDSFTAAGRIGSLQRGGEDCLRSTQNYPSLVAHHLGYALRDVSCFGASTKDALAGSDIAPPQVAAVNRKTSVVTVSIGGNDLGVYSSVFLQCIRASQPNGPGAPCEAMFDRKLTAKSAQVAQRVGAILDDVERRAPKARILVITYLSLMPNDLACSATPFTDRDVLWFAGVESRLAAAIASAAEQRDIDVLDAHRMSQDHNVCTGRKAWVNGPRPKPLDGILYHPNRVGERELASHVEAWIRKGKSAKSGRPTAAS